MDIAGHFPFFTTEAKLDIGIDLHLVFRQADYLELFAVDTEIPLDTGSTVIGDCPFGLQAPGSRTRRAAHLDAFADRR